MLSKLLRGVWDNIKTELGTFFSSLISLVLIFTLINMFLFGAINLNIYRIKAENSNQAIIYVENLDADKRAEFENKVKNIEGISSIEYVSKQTALDNIAKELNVELNGEDNPLEDSYFVFIKKGADVNNLRVDLESLSEITSMDLREDVITKTFNFSNGLDSFIKYASISLAVFAFIMIYTISISNVKTRKTEIYSNLIKGHSKLFIRTTFFIESVINILISGGISYLAYTYIRKNAIGLVQTAFGEDVQIAPMNQEIQVLLVVILLTVLLSLIINYILLGKYFRISYYEKLYKLEAEELEEAFEQVEEVESEVEVESEERFEIEEEVKEPKKLTEIEKLKNMIHSNKDMSEFEETGKED